jgi:predicted ATPase with chaperone activity
MNEASLRESRLSSTSLEVERRTLEAASDSGAVIKGLECAKRALVVAATGGHSICFYCTKHSGKTMLRALGLKLGHKLTFEARTCPCGNYNDPRLTCRCSEAKVRKALDAVPQAEIYCEVNLNHENPTCDRPPV